MMITPISIWISKRAFEVFLFRRYDDDTSLLAIELGRFRACVSKKIIYKVAFSLIWKRWVWRFGPGAPKPLRPGAEDAT